MKRLFISQAFLKVFGLLTEWMIFWLTNFYWRALNEPLNECKLLAEPLTKPLQFSKASYLERIKSAQNAMQMQKFNFQSMYSQKMVMKEKKLWKRYKKKCLNQTNSKTHKSNSEDTNKIVKLLWIPIIGPQIKESV